MSNAPEFDLEIDDKYIGTLVIKCPECRKKTKKKLKLLRAGSEVKCLCGYIIQVSGNELKSAQKSLDDFKRSLEKLGK